MTAIGTTQPLGAGLPNVGRARATGSRALLSGPSRALKHAC
jgi:hypothetical protein